jgi:hypothetical protein
MVARPHHRDDGPPRPRLPGDVAVMAPPDGRARRSRLPRAGPQPPRLR